jgi:hypothetical protein
MVNQSPANSLSAGAALHELIFLGSSYNFLVYVYRGSPVRTINSNTATGPLLRVNQSPATIYHMSTACRNGGCTTRSCHRPSRQSICRCMSTACRNGGCTTRPCYRPSRQSICRHSSAHSCPGSSSTRRCDSRRSRGG